MSESTVKIPKELFAKLESLLGELKQAFKTESYAAKPGFFNVMLPNSVEVKVIDVNRDFAMLAAVQEALKEAGHADLESWAKAEMSK